MARIIASVTLGASLVLSLSTQAAAVLWNVPVTITGDADVSTAGTLACAFCFNTAQTVNGVAFTVSATTPPTWLGTVSASPNIYFGTTVTGSRNTSAFSSTSAPFSGLSVAYRAVLQAAQYVSSQTVPQTVILTNLTVGHQYAVQFWVNDPRGSGTGSQNRTETLASSGGNSVTLNFCAAHTAGSPGQYSLGKFTADATTQTFTVTADANGQTPQLNAIQLRDLGVSTVTLTPVFSPVAGTYTGAQSVTIFSETGSTVFYTTNGAAPTSASANGGIDAGSTIVSIPTPASLTIKAFATNSAKSDSATASAAYVTIPPPTATPTFSLAPGTYLGMQSVTVASESGSTVFYTLDGSLPTNTSASGGIGAAFVTINIPAPTNMTIITYATNSSRQDSGLASAFYGTVTNVATTTIFTGPHRQGTNKDGVVKTGWGVEQTMMYENGIFRSWYHGAPDSGGDYWNNPVIRYATSPDGSTWTDQGVCLTNTPYYRACPYTYHLMSASAAGEPAGYYMPVGRNGQFGFDLFYSTNGLPGTWQWLNNSNEIIPLGSSGQWDSFRSGNICIWYENNQWQVMYEGGPVSGSWCIGRAYGATLTNLTKYPGNPVLTNTPFPGSCIGGVEVHKVGNVYYSIVHETDPRGASTTPTSCSLYKSFDLNNWTRMGWISRLWVNKESTAQVADGTLISTNGKTYLWYEDQAYQNPTLPSLSLMIWDMPMEDLVNHPEWLDDTAAEGWSFEPNSGEVPTASGSFPTTYFRKLSAPISPNCLIVVADSTHQLKARKPVGLSNNVFNFSARAEQTNVKFTPLRLDADTNNTVLAGAYFDTDGNIKYYNGAGISAAQSYTPTTIYTISYNCSPGGYSLTINGSLVASNINYASSYVAPAYYKTEMASGGTGYVGTPALIVQATLNHDYWTAAINGNWDTNTANWTTNGVTATYSDGDTIHFDDTATGTSPLSVTVTAVCVSPGGIVASNFAKDYILGGNPISSIGGLTKLGTGTLTLTGADTFIGVTAISGGTLQIGAGGAAGSLTTAAITNNGSLVFNRSDANDINVPIIGTGSLVVSAGAGTAGIRGPVSLGSVSAASTFAASAQSLYGSSYASAINLFTNITTTGSQTYNGIVSIGRGTSTSFVTTLTTTGGGSINLPSGVISGLSGYWASGVLNLNTATGNGSVTLGGTSVPYGVGNLNINSGTGLITLTGGYYCYDFSAFNGPVMLAGNANFQPVNSQQWARGVTFAGDLTGAFTLTATLGSGAGSSTGSGTSGLNFSNATIQSVSANIAGSSGLTKLGSGVTTLTGTNTYTGMTAISNGTLVVNGSLAAGSAVTIASAGTLGGTGIIAGTVTVNGTIAPGTNGVGTLNTGTETWNGGGSCLCQINSTNAGGLVLLNITGALNVLATSGNNFTVKVVSLTAGNTAGRLASFNKFTNYSWPFATASGGISNFAANKFNVDASAFANDFSGGAFTLSTNGNSLLVKYLAAPLVSPKFTGIAGGGGLQLSGTGGVGQAYVLLAATNLVPANWMPIATNLANTNSIFQFTDPQTTNYGERFYRLSNP